MVSKESSHMLTSQTNGKSTLADKLPGTMTVRSVLLNRDSPDIESRLKKRRNRTHQVRFKDLEDGSSSSGNSGTGDCSSHQKASKDSASPYPLRKHGSRPPLPWVDEPHISSLPGQTSVVGAVRGDMASTIEVVAAFLARAPPHPLTPGPTRKCWTPPQANSLTLPMTRKTSTSTAIQTSPCLKKPLGTHTRSHSLGDSVAIDGDDEHDSQDENFIHNHLSTHKSKDPNGPSGCPERTIIERKSKSRTEMKSAVTVVKNPRHSCQSSVSHTELCHCCNVPCRESAKRQGSSTPSLVRRRKRFSRTTSDPGKEVHYCTTPTQTDSHSLSPPRSTSKLCTTQVQTESSSSFSQPKHSTTHSQTERHIKSFPVIDPTPSSLSNLDSTQTSTKSTSRQTLATLSTEPCTTQPQLMSLCASKMLTKQQNNTMQIRSESLDSSLGKNQDSLPNNTVPYDFTPLTPDIPTHITPHSADEGSSLVEKTSCAISTQMILPRPCSDVDTVTPPSTTFDVKMNSVNHNNLHQSAASIVPPHSVILLHPDAPVVSQCTRISDDTHTVTSVVMEQDVVTAVEQHPVGPVVTARSTPPADTPNSAIPVVASSSFPSVVTSHSIVPVVTSPIVSSADTLHSVASVSAPHSHNLAITTHDITTSETSHSVAPVETSQSVTPVVNQQFVTSLSDSPVTTPHSVTTLITPHSVTPVATQRSVMAPTVSSVVTSQAVSSVVTPNSVVTTQSVTLHCVSPVVTPHFATAMGVPHSIAPVVTPDSVTPIITPQSVTSNSVAPVVTPHFATAMGVSHSTAPVVTPDSVTPIITPQSVTSNSVAPVVTPHFVRAIGTPRSATPVVTPNTVTPIVTQQSLTPVVPPHSVAPMVTPQPTPTCSVVTQQSAMPSSAVILPVFSCSTSLSVIQDCPAPMPNNYPSASLTCSTPIPRNTQIVPTNMTDIARRTPTPVNLIPLLPSVTSPTNVAPCTFVTQTAISCTSISYYTTTHHAVGPSGPQSHIFPPAYATLVQTVSHCNIPCQVLQNTVNTKLTPFSSPVPKLKSCTSQPILVKTYKSNLPIVQHCVTPTKKAPLYSSTFRAAPPYTPPCQTQDKRGVRLPPPPPPPPPYTPRKITKDQPATLTPMLRTDNKETEKDKDGSKDKKDIIKSKDSPKMSGRASSLRHRAQTPPVALMKERGSPAKVCLKSACLSSAQAQLGVLHKMLCSGARPRPNTPCQFPLPQTQQGRSRIRRCSVPADSTTTGPLTPAQADTLRQVQEILGGLMSGTKCKLDPSKVTERLLSPNGPLRDIRSLQTQLQSLEGVLETSQNTIKVLLDVIQDLEKKEAVRDGRHLYRTGQDIENCGTCRDCACIIYRAGEPQMKSPHV